jgi:O-antigen/teichoic acid export membrane protein
VFLAAAQITNPFLSMVFVLLLARRLDANGLGIYTTVLTYFAVFNLFSTLGMNELIVRDVAADRKRGPAAFSGLFWIGVTTSLVLIVAMQAVARLLRYEPVVVQSIAIISCGLPFYTLGMFNQAFLQAFERMEWCSALTIGETLWKVVLGILVLLAGLGIRWIIATVTVGYALSCLVGLWAVNRYAFTIRLRTPGTMAAHFLKQAPTFLALSVVVMVYWSTDIMMLSKMRGMEEVGFYSSGYRLLTIAKGLINAYIMAMFPMLSHLYTQSANAFRNACERSIKALIVVTVPLALCISLFAREILVLVYGVRFAQAAPTLSVLIWPLVFFPIANVLGNALLASHHQSVDLWINLASALLNILLNALLITHAGYFGAAVATALSIVFFVLLQSVAVRKVLFALPYRSLMARPLFALAVSAGIMVLVRRIHPVPALVMGAGVFLGLLIWMGYLAEPERKVVADLWNNKGRLFLFHKQDPDV